MSPRPLYPNQPPHKRKEGRKEGREGRSERKKERKKQGKENAQKKNFSIKAYKFALYQNILIDNILQKDPKIIEQIFPLGA